MMKIVLLLLICLAAWWLFRSRRKAADPEPSGAEEMVVCARCRVHVPISESIAVGERRYCCDEHRKLDAG